MRSNPAWVLLEVLGLDDATYVDPLRADEEGELGGVLDSLGERVDLEDGEAADQLLGFGEGAVDDPDLAGRGADLRGRAVAGVPASTNAARHTRDQRSDRQSAYSGDATP